MKHLVIALALAFSAQTAHADQVIDGYTTDAQQDDSTLGLAISDGRYEITLGDDCGWVGSWMNINVYSEFGHGLVLTPRDSDWPQCHVGHFIRRDPTPCFKDADMCDVAQELE